jgi:signal transduction histidine kinase/DNA-binding response OmpR family regulator
MNRLFRKLSLPAKLTLMALIPLALLAWFAVQIYQEKTEKINILNTYLQRIEQSADISMMVDHLQSERRYSFRYVLNRQSQGEMAVQRPLTDSALEKLERYQPLEGLTSYTFLDSLTATRNRIDEGAADPVSIMSYYTNALFRLNTLNVISGGSISYLEPVKGELQGQKLLSEMVTYLGILRANVYYALYSSQPGNITAMQSKAVYDIYKSYVTELKQKGSAEAIDQFYRLQTTSDLKATEKYMEQLLQTGTYDSTMTSEEWWQVSANGVDEIRKLQRSLLEQARTSVKNIYEKEKAARDQSPIFLILSIALVIALIIYTISVITRTLGRLNYAANKISQGATGVDIHVESNDVIGSLAQSMIRLDENNKDLAQAADAIGSGNFNVEVHPRSEEDVLGNAIVKMKNDLQQFNHENEEKLWIHSGMEKINETLRGDKNIRELCDGVLDTLASHVNSEVGLFFVRANGHLDYVSGYAIPHDDSVPRQVALGETLIGQAAQKAELMHLRNVPSRLIRVRSGSLDEPPGHIIIVPLIHNDYVEGVLELASLMEFRPEAVNYISQVAPVIAVALQSAKTRARMQELLEQTQAQAEELQAQHGELENINAELEAQTEKLQVSEEELKVQQEELLQANQELEERSRLLEERNQMIVEKNMDIQQKAEELELSTRYKSEFLANMSHELRTPLNSVLLLSRLLAENNEKNLSPEQVEYATVIQSSGQGLLSLIDEILDLSKIEAGKMELEYHPVMLGEIVNDMKALFSPVAREKGLEFSINLDPQLPSQIETDKMRLEQVLKNLLSNALKFTSQGSVKMDITTTRQDSPFISFSVKDTGIGIPREKQGLIFEAFQQADGSTRRKYGGTGLGLSISRELTRLLGGEMKVSSEPGKGSDFTIYIPVSKSIADQELQKDDLTQTVTQAEPERETPMPQVQGKSFRTDRIPEAIPDDRSQVQPNDQTILIIEDDTGFARALLDFTRKRGYKGLVAVRGDEGIALAQQFRPLGILLDIQLPVKDGWEVMDELKNNPLTRHIPVHIMSSMEVKKESLVKGAVDFINKPVAFEQMQEVFKKIEHLLSKEHKKVLIIEENPRHAKALAYFLENFDVNTEISGSVNQGVDALKKESVDCVILDMGIPDQHAYETLERVKKQEGLENLPIIIFTGRSLSKNEESRIKQYADSIVIKTAHSYQRILDEVSLFLHLVEENNGEEKRSVRYKRLGALNEVLAGKKILVVDDDVRNIFSLTKALEIHNMEVITAVDGREALNQLQEHPGTDVVLMDIMMPEMDGYEAMQAIRQKREFRNLPIIAVTAKAMTGDREKCIQAGASDYISKPVDIDQLLSLLRVWLYDKSI